MAAAASPPAGLRLDTHVVVWLFTGEVGKLSDVAAGAIEAGVPEVSPMVQLELTFLHEIGRLAVSGSEILDDLSRRIGLGLSSVPMASAVAAAAPVKWTRDPFDRMIVGDALAAGTPLLTRDASIRRHVSLATW